MPLIRQQTRKFDVDTEIPDLSGKVILVTGGNEGIGKHVCLAVAKHNPAHVYIAARDAEKAKVVIAEIQTSAPNVPVSFIQMDLSSFESVRKAGQEIINATSRLDYIFLNAGVMALNPSLSTDGYEIQFAINHLGHAMLTKLLLPTILKTAALPDSDVRIIVTTSSGYFLGPKGGILFDKLCTTQADLKPMARYGQSKLANIFYAAELSKHYPSVKSVSVAPGVTWSELFQKAKFGNFLEDFAYKTLIRAMNQPVEEGAWNLLWAAFSPKEGVVNGEYYDVPFGTVGKRNIEAKKEKLSEELWAWTETELEKGGVNV